MISGDVLISADTVVNLGGDEAAAELMASLWAVDCQSCGRPLGAKPPALAVDDLAVFGWASLHHPRCRPPGWNSGSVIAHPTAAGVTHRSRLVMMPTQKYRWSAQPDRMMPMMVVNPGMESVTLRQDRGRWRPQLHQMFADAGMVPPGPKLRIGRPIRGVAAELTATTARVTVRTLPDGVYESDLDAEIGSPDQFRRQITSQGGIMLAVSHFLDPADGDALAGHLTNAMRDCRMLCGWAALTR
jgi:hypothetical protein